MHFYVPRVCSDRNASSFIIHFYRSTDFIISVFLFHFLFLSFPLFSIFFHISFLPASSFVATKKFPSSSSSSWIATRVDRESLRGEEKTRSTNERRLLTYDHKTFIATLRVMVKKKKKKKRKAKKFDRIRRPINQQFFASKRDRARLEIFFTIRLSHNLNYNSIRK